MQRKEMFIAMADAVANSVYESGNEWKIANIMLDVAEKKGMKPPEIRYGYFETVNAWDLPEPKRDIKNGKPEEKL